MIAIEPLAITIRSNNTITGIRYGTNEHKLALYADDLLAFVTDPANPPPPLQCLQQYSAASGYKLNLTKSEVLPLNIQDNYIKNLTRPLHWRPNGFKYLGIEIRTSVDKTFKENQVKIDLQNWRDLPLSLIGRVNLIKMCILPKFLYLFQCIPFKIPKPFFDDLNKSLRSFLWKGKPPRVKHILKEG